MLRNRNLNIEALRVYMMFLIVVLHITGSYLDIEGVRQCCSLNMGWLLGYRSLTFLGVSTFAFISGYYGVKLHLDKAFAMEIMAISYGVFVLVALYVHVGHISMGTVRDLLFPITSNHLWYFSGYMILILISPFLNEGIKVLSKKMYFKTLTLLIVLICGFRFISGGANADFLNLLVVYLTGRYLRIYPCEALIKRSTEVLFSCLIVNFLISFSLGCMGMGKLNLIFEGNNNPFTVLGAISLFYSFLKMKKVSFLNRIVSFFAPYMLAVYVFHELLRTEGLIDFAVYKGNILFVFPLALVIVITISLIERGRVFLVRPLTGKINKYLV